MVVIHEWLPNPEGLDREGEWVELANIGTRTVDLAGWTLSTGGKTNYTLRESLISPGDFRVFRRGETRLALRNEGGEVLLYDATGALVDRGAFLGTAPEGKSWNRSDSGFFWSEPTPGGENAQVPQPLEGARYADGAALNPGLLPAGAVGLSLVTGLVLALIALFLVKENHALSKLFFSRD